MFILPCLPEWGELCRHWKAKSNIIFMLVCAAITSIDSSWEASGHTPYRIDFSWEKAAVCRWSNGRNKQGGRWRRWWLWWWDQRHVGIMEHRTGTQGRCLVKCVQSRKCGHFFHDNWDVWSIFSVVLYKHCWFPVRPSTRRPFAVNESIIDWKESYSL